MNSHHLRILHYQTTIKEWRQCGLGNLRNLNSSWIRIIHIEDIHLIQSAFFGVVQYMYKSLSIWNGQESNCLQTVDDVFPPPYRLAFRMVTQLECLDWLHVKRINK